MELTNKFLLGTKLKACGEWDMKKIEHPNDHLHLTSKKIDA